MTEHETKTTAAEHMAEFYRPFAEVRDEKFDGLIITGAPIEHLDYSDVTYWDELTEVFNWTQTNVHHTFGVCWGGMAMLWHFPPRAKAHAGGQGLWLFPTPQLGPRFGLFARVFRMTC